MQCNMSKLSLSSQLTIVTFSFILSFSIMIGWSAYHAQNNQKLTEQAFDLSRDRLARSIRVEGFVHTNVARIRAVAASQDTSLEALFRPDISKTEAEFVKDLEAIEALPLNQEEKQTLADLKKNAAITIPATNKIRELKDQGNFEEAALILKNEFDSAAQGLIDAASHFQQLQQQKTDAVRETLANNVKQSNILLISTGIIIALCVFILLIAIRKQIVNALNEVVQFTNRVASGDLTGEITTTRKDELGTLILAVNAMNQSLAKLVTRVRHTSQQIQSEATDIANSSTELSSRTEQTASNLEQTAASMEELATAVAQSAHTAKEANALVSTVGKAALHGNEVVEQVIRSMHDIRHSSSKISDIIQVIDSIAFQTNILALNAAVEAARAGEEGRGFAVVATEVRTLAKRSADAAKEIATLITTSVDTVKNGSSQVEEAGHSMEDILNGVKKVTALIEEITTTSSEQHDGINQVNQAVSHLDQMTQQNAAMVEESTSSATTLQHEAQEMVKLVSVFKVDHLQLNNALQTNISHTKELPLIQQAA